MKFLIIDSHKGNQSIPQNLHWINADKIRQHLTALGHEVDLIWSYPTVNTTIKMGYDRIIFNHASRYSYISDEWLKKSPSAKYFYITNEYNLGEPLLIWSWVKEHGTQYTVIANHPATASKVVQKYVDAWHTVNLNALVIDPAPKKLTYTFFDFTKDNCVYYGSFRKDRTKYFTKYLTGRRIIISTHPKNQEKFHAIGVTGPFRNRIDWASPDLNSFKTSLYIEDETTHTHYNFLANRFYESINHNVFPLFDSTCKRTLDLSGYEIPEYAIVDTLEQVEYITRELPASAQEYIDLWRNQALREKQDVLNNITTLVTT
jgi:hypothetical protein